MLMETPKEVVVVVVDDDVVVQKTVNRMQGQN